ncbi:hypothetical protein HDU97_007341 [Phlyctochytrium planicorne]|nr:hypothetical protein HDU97_007341 [Phlyctochytrium planicorne]
MDTSLFDPKVVVEQLSQLDLETQDPLDLEYTYDQWVQIAFHCVSSEPLEYLEWMIKRKPGLIGARHWVDGRTLLHEAVREGDLDKIKVLQHIETIMVPDANGQTAFEVAIDLGDDDTVLEFVPWMEAMQTTDANPYGKLEAMVHEATDMDCYPELLGTLKTAYVHEWLRRRDPKCQDSLPEPEQWWWTPGNWSDTQYFRIYRYLVNHCIDGKWIQVRRLMELTKISCLPRSSTTSTPDAAALGWLLDLSNFQDVDESMIWQYEVIAQTWDADILTLEDCIRKVKASDYLRFVSPNMKFLSRPTLERIDCVKMFASRIEEDGIAALPRLDKLIFYNQYEILKWLVDDKLLDMNFATALKTRLLGDGHDGQNTQEEEVSDPCAICLCSKEIPFPLHDNHTFCLACTSEYFSSVTEQGHYSNETLKCPLCNQPCKIPNMVALASRLICIIEEEYSWLILGTGWPIYKILLGLAAGLDSVIIFEWLIAEYNIDLRTCLFDRGETVLHLAASTGSSLVSKWLVTHHDYLVIIRNEDGDVALMNCITSSSPCSHIALKQIDSKSDIPPSDWVSKALESSSTEIAEYARSRLGTPYDQIYNLLSRNADTEAIVKCLNELEYFKPNFRLDQPEHKELQFCSMLAEFDRLDLFQAILCMDLQDSRLDLEGEIWRQILGSLSEVSKNIELKALVEEWKEVQNVADKIRRQIRNIREWFPGDETITGLRSYLEKYDSLIGQLKTLDPNKKFFTTRYIYEYFTFNKTFHIRGGLTPLGLAIAKNDPNLFDYLAERFQIDPLEASGEFQNINLSLVGKETVGALASYLSRNGHSTEGIADLLTSFITRHSMYLFLPTSDGKEDDYNAAHVEDVIRYTRTLTDIDIVKHIRKHDKFFTSSFLMPLYCECCVEKTAEEFLRLVKLAVEMGIDFVDTNHNQSLIHSIFKRLDIQRLPAVRYLALEKGLNVQHLEPNFSKPGSRERTEMAWKGIKMAQRDMMEMDNK